MQLSPVLGAPCLESKGALEKAELLNLLAFQWLHVIELAEGSLQDSVSVPAPAKPFLGSNVSQWLRRGRRIIAT